MSMNIYMPVQEVVSLLDKEGLPAELIGSMKVGRYGGEMRTALYDLDDVRQFIKKNRPASVGRGSSLNNKEDSSVIAINQTVGKAAGGPLLKTKQAAQYLAIGERQLQYEVGRRNIRCVRLGKNCIRFTQEDLDEYVDRHRSNSQAAGGN